MLAVVVVVFSGKAWNWEIFFEAALLADNFKRSIVAFLTKDRFILDPYILSHMS